MPVTDLSFPLTAKAIGPTITPATRTSPAIPGATGAPGAVGDLAFSPVPRVYYTRSSDIVKIEPDVNRLAVTLKVLGTQKKVMLFESPDEFGCAQALAQGATAAPNVVKHMVTAITATSSATAADQTALRYYNQVTTNVAASRFTLPDPFAGRRLIIIDNLTTGSIGIIARGATSAINGVTSGYTIGPFERVHFVAPTAATLGTTVGWKVARDPGA